MGPGRCTRQSECQGERICSYWGFCTGNSDCDVKSTLVTPPVPAEAKEDTVKTKKEKIPIKILVNKSVKRQIRRESDKNEKLIKKLARLENKIRKEREKLIRK